MKTDFKILKTSLCYLERDSKYLIFAILVVGAILNSFGYPAQYTGDVSTPETPPAFIVQAEDDFCEVATAKGLSLALTKAGVANEMSLYSDGGHGYGRRILGRATDIWSHYAALWLVDFLK